MILNVKSPLLIKQGWQVLAAVNADDKNLFCECYYRLLSKENGIHFFINKQRVYEQFLSNFYGWIILNEQKYEISKIQKYFKIFWCFLLTRLNALMFMQIAKTKIS